MRTAEHNPESSEALPREIREILRSIKSVNYGSVEIVIQNSRIVQIERKEKFRFDRD
jgi:hypothetical protein